MIENPRKMKLFKDRINPFTQYTDKEFRSKYRFSKDGVRFLENLIGDSLIVDKRGGGLSLTLQLPTALRYWGRNEIQDDAADIHGLSQQYITNVCRCVARAILEKRFDYIKMPSLNEELILMRQFEQIAGFKKVIGTIDCTHIRIPKIKGPSGQY
ncbi:putative nuclease HARBI1 [Diabrotica virgifera virgifera]|uniref:Nuclease HARBI1 n=1 Tax=Diabrotica virgifera virgifera TaxID=50390 RepID=A0ABM5L2C7_DIAVI|nr:putative nuclease HARBI1 [Diabrotica virgifera virgifera]